MEETKPRPIRIKLVPQLEGSYLDEAGKKRLSEQLGPGAVNIIQKYIQVCMLGTAPVFLCLYCCAQQGPAGQQDFHIVCGNLVLSNSSNLGIL
jgi:hypothetical protein